MALSSYSKVNVDGGFGFMVGTHPAYFFHRTIGVFSGIDYIQRPFELNDAQTLRWIEIPFGLAFRNSVGSNSLVGLGLSISLPLDNFEDSSTTYVTQGGLSLVFLANRYYDLTPDLSFGIYSDVRYSFHSPFEQASLDRARMFSLLLGLGLRVRL
jgi:hypothetical protein